MPVASTTKRALTSCVDLSPPPSRSRKPFRFALTAVEARPFDQRYPVLQNFPRKKRIEAPPIEVPAISQRIEQKVVVAERIVAPGRATAEARLVGFLQEIVPHSELFQNNAGIRRNAFADSDRFIMPGLDHQDPERA